MASLEQNQKAGEKVAKDDGELGVLSLIVGAFETLDDKEVDRALRYLGDRYMRPKAANARPTVYIGGGQTTPSPNLC